MMMRLTLLLILLTSMVTHLIAQSQPRAAIIDQTPLTGKGIYRYQEFTEGTVVFRNGIISDSKMNYNITLDEMHFITREGDTLALTDPVTIHFVSINGTRFYYDKGYLQTVDSSYNDVILAYRQVLVAEQQRHGGYGIQRPHEGVRTYNYFTGNGQTYKLGEDEEVLVTAKDYFFFGDQYGHFSRAGKDFILQRYDNKQSEIRAFIKTNHINFNIQANLLKLLQFCRQL